jgi:hypothetical protein
MKLSGSERSYRVRVGDYRILYDVFSGRLLIEIPVITGRLARDARAHEPQWTDSIAVGSGAWEAIAETMPPWQRLSDSRIGESA